MTKPLKFTVGQKVQHPRFGNGRIFSVWAVAEAGTSQETEYVVKLVGERWPAYLGEESLTVR